jgi:hypothetical protein
MDPTRLISALDRFPAALVAAVRGFRAEDARWRPPDSAWSLLEIVAHLADEEVEDFRLRLRLTLEDETAAWPPIDPEAAARDRRYNDGDLAEALERFTSERAASLAWLRALGRADWGRAHRHPKLGAIRAGDLLAAWAAHDLLHLRQIAKRSYQIVRRDAGEFETGYAGALGT